MPGGEWQDLCLDVLRIHHDVDLVEVPDTDQGDAGLEAYTMNGVAYQSYSPIEPLTVKARYEKQRQKMTDDVTKFINNETKLKAMFGDLKIRRWTLLVPRWESKELVAHAQVQTKRLADANLPYVAADIGVLIRTIPDNFKPAHAALVRHRLTRLELPQPGIPDYSHIDTELIERMRTKLQKVPALAADVDRLAMVMQEFLEAHVIGSGYRSYVRDFFVDIDRTLDERFEVLKGQVKLDLPLQEPRPEALLSRTIELAVTIAAEAMNSDERRSRSVGLGQVADLLMQCPLDFPDVVTA